MRELLELKRSAAKYMRCFTRLRRCSASAVRSRAAASHCISSLAPAPSARSASESEPDTPDPDAVAVSEQRDRGEAGPSAAASAGCMASAELVISAEPARCLSIFDCRIAPRGVDVDCARSACGLAHASLLPWSAPFVSSNTWKEPARVYLHCACS